MKKEEVLTQVISAVEGKSWETAERNLAEDFTFTGAVPRPLGKEEWIKVNQAIISGLPDLRYNLKQITQKGDDKLSAKVKLTGTHVYEMPSIFQGQKPIKSTGKKVELPEEEIEVTFKGDKISGLDVKPVSDGGVRGILTQLGAAASAS